MMGGPSSYLYPYPPPRPTWWQTLLGVGVIVTLPIWLLPLCVYWLGQIGWLIVEGLRD